MKIVCVHGWGLAPDFWDGLAAHFSDAEITRVNLGYRGEADYAVPDEKALYITHSLGTLWALDHCANKMDGLVVINGFLDFPMKKALPLMKRHLDLAQFFENAGILSVLDGFNEEALLGGLDYLAEKDLRADYDFPILALAGMLDVIVPLHFIQEQFDDVRVQALGGHALPQSHTDWCADEIRGFL